MDGHILVDSNTAPAKIMSEGKEVPNPLFATWQHEDKLVTSFITATLKSEVRSLIIDSFIAKEV